MRGCTVPRKRANKKCVGAVILNSKLGGRGRASLRLRIFCSSKCGSPASVTVKEMRASESQTISIS